MGARCWECGDKIGRCYEHGSSDCGCLGCGCEPIKVITVQRVAEDEDVDW